MPIYGVGHLSELLVISHISSRQILRWYYQIDSRNALYIHFSVSSNPATTSWNRFLDKFDDFKKFPLYREFQVSLLAKQSLLHFPILWHMISAHIWFVTCFSSSEGRKKWHTLTMPSSMSSSFHPKLSSLTSWLNFRKCITSIMVLEESSVPFGCITPTPLTLCRAGWWKCWNVYCQIFCVSQQLTVMAIMVIWVSFDRLNMCRICYFLTEVK